MQPFVRITGKAVALLEDNVDTDAIFPARYLLLMEKAGLGPYLFHDRRTAAASGAGLAFPLDHPAFAGAVILLGGANFGCGSSREHAVWALAGAGFRCVIAPSFGDIFQANCFKNGVLPIALPAEVVAALAAQADAGAPFTIDLVDQTIAIPGRPAVGFSVSPQKRAALLSGNDEIDEILLGEDGIAAFEVRHRAAQPWLFTGEAVPIRARNTHG